MQKKRHLLLTNDDGIHALGLRHLWKALSPHFTITIVAPQSEQSSVGLSITTRTPLQVQQIDWPDSTQAFSVTGTPADCVKLACSKILSTPPDLIIAGINRGSNAGRNVLYSGTVAGIIEGVMRDIPGIAFSTADYDRPNYEPAEVIIPLVVDHVLAHPLPTGSILNVNFPELPLAGYRGLKLTRQGKQFWTENPDERMHPSEGHSYYWLGSRRAVFEEHEESDIYWLERGYVTAAPLHFQELTDHGHLEKHKDSFDSLFKG